MPSDNAMPALLSENDSAQMLGCKPATLRKWRCIGGGPRFIKVGRTVRYDPHDLAAFIAAGRRTSTSDRGGR